MAPALYGRGPYRLSGGVAVNPGVYLALAPAQVLADPVGRQFPLAPSLADRALGDCEYRGYLARGQQPVRPAQRAGARVTALVPIGIHLCWLVLRHELVCRRASPPL